MRYSFGSSDFNLQSVVRQADVRRQALLGARMGQIVADMREENALGGELHGRRNRAVHSRMRGMRFVTQRVEKQHVQPLQSVERRSGISL